MDTTKLVAALDQAIAQERPIGEKMFLRLLKEVWQVDWTVAPYDVWYRMMTFDIRYFSSFMDRDEGDEIEEDQLIKDWRDARWELKITPRMRMIPLIEEANHIRMNAQIE